VLAQDFSFDYSPEKETAYCLRVSWQGETSPVQLLIGVRDKDKDYGPYKRLELLRSNRDEKFEKPVILPASQLSAGPEVLADFSPAGVLWYARPAEGNHVRINRVTGSEVLDHQIQLGSVDTVRDLVISTLRAVSDTEVWLVGRQANQGILIRLSNLKDNPEISHIPLSFALKDALPNSGSEFILAGTSPNVARSKTFAVTSHLTLLSAGLKVIAPPAPIDGWLQDTSPVSSDRVAVLTSKVAPGELSLHVLTKDLIVKGSVTFLKERSFTGRAFLISHEDFVIAFASNLGKCSVSVFEADTGRLVKRESIETGRDRCIDIRVAQSGKQLLLATTLWHLEGNAFRVGVRTSIRSIGDLVALSAFERRTP